MLHTGKRLPTSNRPAGQGNLTGTSGLASVQRATGIASPYKTPTATPNPAGVSPNALFPPRADRPITGRPSDPTDLLQNPVELPILDWKRKRRWRVAKRRVELRAGASRSAEGHISCCMECTPLKRICLNEVDRAPGSEHRSRASPNRRLRRVPGSLRACEKIVASEGRSRSAGAQEPECMYEIHEDSEHRRNARSRAQ
jgi:hypothetical protein